MAWKDLLSYELSLTDGRVLRTLHDVMDIFASGSFTDIAHAPALKSALDLVITAAESGNPNDLKAATDQVAAMLRMWRMM
jgi:hypothetical protein